MQDTSDSHPLTEPRMLANYGLLAFTGIGVALMSIEIFVVGTLICLAAVAGIGWLYLPEIRRLRLRLVGGIENQTPSKELWLALGIGAVAIAAPASIYFYQHGGRADEVAVLKEKLTQLTANRWEPLKPNEITSLRELIRNFPPQTFSVACNFDTCHDLGKSIYEVFHDLGWPGTYHMGFVSHESGLHAYSGNPAISEIIGAIEKGTNGRLKITIHTQLTGHAVRDNEILLSVGRK
jgi:hypothetical protein